jgi:pumilio family protein 6
MYKTLLQGGHFNKKAQKVDLTGNWNPRAFAVSFVNTVPKNSVVGMCIEGERNGSFVVAILCEMLAVGVGEGGDGKKEREMLKRWFGEEERRVIREGEGRGKELLLEKLALL